MLGVAGAEFAQPRYATDAAAAEAICRAAGATLILAPGTSRWARVAAGVAQRLQGRADTHATAITVENGAPRVSRWYYRQRMEAVVLRTQRPWLILLDPGCVPPWEGAPGKAHLELLSVPVAENWRRTTVTGVKSPAADAQTIRPDANLLFRDRGRLDEKTGRWPDARQGGGEFDPGFPQGTRASLGSSKSLVDLSGEGQAVLSFLTHLNQIGQTGSTPRHPKGLATCCHGEEPHSVGWRFITERRAINLDANCGWARGKRTSCTWRTRSL